MVCWAIAVITLMTLPMSALLSPSLATTVLVLSATRTAADATFVASEELREISRMLALICSVALATLATFLLTSSDAAETTTACCAVSSALAPISFVVTESFVDDSMRRRVTSTI